MSIKDYLTNDQELIQACIQNNPKAQRVLFERNAGKMLGICTRYCQNLEDSKDAMHEGFIKVFKQLPKFKGESKLDTWMTRIMIYTAIDHFKKSVKYNFYENDEDVYKAAGNTNYSENYAVEYNEDNTNLSKLREIIRQLPTGYRIVFTMYAIDNLPHKEIAKQLGITEGTSKSQLARARKLLQSLVKAQLNIG